MTLTKFMLGGYNAGGRLKLDDERDFRRLMRQVADGVRLTVTVEEEKKKRRGWLNRFYWGFVITPTSEHYGYTKEEMHEAWKWRFLRLEDTDHPMPTVRSTTTLSQNEMQRYIEDIRIAAAQDGCDVPEPNEHRVTE